MFSVSAMDQKVHQNYTIITPKVPQNQYWKVFSILQGIVQKWRHSLRGRGSKILWRQYISLCTKKSDEECSGTCTFVTHLLVYLVTYSHSDRASLLCLCLCFQRTPKVYKTCLSQCLQRNTKVYKTYCWLVLCKCFKGSSINDVTALVVWGGQIFCAGNSLNTKKLSKREGGQKVTSFLNDP